jgi:sugar O-acyltransferase (sialic acid O-acetyltransferase NeuD family)
MLGRPVVVFGLGDFARLANYYFRHDSPHRVVAHTVTSAALTSREFMGLPVVPFEELSDHYSPDTVDLFIAVGYSRVNRNRREIFTSARGRGYRMVTYVCSKATTWPDLHVGEGSFVFENNVIQPYVEIGENTVLWSGNHIGHDSRIGSHVFLASHVVVSGNCRIGDGTFIGVNATLRDGISVGAECVVGAGTLVLGDVPDHAVLKGAATPISGLASPRLRRI